MIWAIAFSALLVGGVLYGALFASNLKIEVQLEIASLIVICIMLTFVAITMYTAWEPLYFIGGTVVSIVEGLLIKTIFDKTKELGGY